MRTCLSESQARVRIYCLCPCLMGLIPKSGDDSPGSLPGGWAPGPRLEREVGVSQLDVAQGCPVPEQDQGLVLRKTGEMAVGSSANCVFHTVSGDYLTDRKMGFVGPEHPPRWLSAGSLRLAAWPHLPLLMLPLCLGKSWVLRKQRTDLVLPAGDKGVGKPGLACAIPSFR